MIIALEGGDAAGKATQSKILVDRLRVEGHEAKSMSFPDYSTETGKLILRLLKDDVYFASDGESDATFESFVRRERAAGALALQALMTVNRYEHYAYLSAWSTKLCHAGDSLNLSASVLVLDRYWLSGLVYGAADGLDAVWLASIHAALPLAHHVFLDVSPEEALRRRPKARDRFERDRDKQVAVCKNYKDVFSGRIGVKGLDTGYLHVVDGEGIVEEVSARVWDVVEQIIKGRK